MSLSIKRVITALVVTALAYVGMIQCWGQFGLYKWGTKVGNSINGSISNKYLGGIVMFVVLWIGWIVLAIFYVLDIAIFNLIEFWTGTNVIARADYDKNGEHKKEVVKKDERAVFHYKRYGQELEITFYKKGKYVKTLVAFKDKPGKFFVRTGSKVERLHMQTAVTPNGKRFTFFEGGRQVGTVEMNQERFQQLMATVQQKVHATTGTLYAGSESGALVR